MFKECRPKAIERERGNTRGSDKNTHIHNTHASFVQRRRLLYSISDIVIFDVAFIDNSDARRKKRKIIIETYLLSRCHTFEIYQVVLVIQSRQRLAYRIIVYVEITTHNNVDGLFSKRKKCSVCIDTRQFSFN